MITWKELQIRKCHSHPLMKKFPICHIFFYFFAHISLRSLKEHLTKNWQEVWHVKLGITNAQSNCQSALCMCLCEICIYAVIQVIQPKSYLKSVYLSRNSFNLVLDSLFKGSLLDSGLLTCKENLRIPKSQKVLKHEKALNCPGNKCQWYKIHIEI